METLADRIAREGPLNELDAVGWAIRLAKRIESMHALGVTHGSVSPQCVQIEGKDRSARAYLVDVRRTSSNPAYHSPERIQGGSLSQADDAWALACTLYAALTGGAPFSGANDAEVKQKVLTSAPAPLAVFDVGDDDLQRVLEDALTRDPAHRTSSVSALRAALEEWHPDPNVGGLPGLEDEDTEGGMGDDEEDERTIMRPAPGGSSSSKRAANTPAAAPVVPAPAPLAPARLVPPVAAPPPRASSPGAPRAPLGSAPGVSPLAQPRLGPAARATPVGAPPAIPQPRGSTPGFPAPAAPPPRASSPGAMRSPLGSASSPDFPAPLASAPSLADFPAPLGPPPGLVAHPLPPGDDEDEDEKTMMRSVPEHLSAAMSARGPSPDAPRTNDVSRSGAFAAAAPSKSGAFPAMAPPVLDRDEGDDAEDEATRMMPSPAFPSSDDDDDQATIMRTSMPPEEAERLQSIGGMPPPASAPRPAAGAAPVAGADPVAGAPAASEPANFAATVALDAMGFAPPPEPPVAPLADARPLDGNPSAAGNPALAGPAAPVAPGSFASGLAALGPPAGAAPIAAPPRRSGAIWIAVILVLAVAAGLTFYFLHLRF